MAGVGVLVAERWIDNIVQVKRVSERLMVVLGSHGWRC